MAGEAKKAGGRGSELRRRVTRSACGRRAAGSAVITRTSVDYFLKVNLSSREQQAHKQDCLAVEM